MKLICSSPHMIWLWVMMIGFTACNAQNSMHQPNDGIQANTLIGDTVEKLGTHLWYIYQDKKNNYWFGSNGEGIYRYDGHTLIQFTTKHGLSNDSIRQIQEDKTGQMYFSTLGGINKFDGKQFSLLPVIKSKDWKLDSNDMWFYMLGKKDEHGPYRYDGKNLYNLQFPNHYLHNEFYQKGINPFFSPYEIYSIYKDRKGVIWFGTSVFGACRYDGKSVKWMYEKDLTIVPNGGSFGIRSIYEDREGHYWFCNTQHRYDINLEATAKSDRLQYNKIKGIGDANVFGGNEYIYYSHIVEDQHGDIWLTTWSEGVYKYDGHHITHYEVRDAEQIVNLVSMYRDRQNNLWLGTPDQGVYKLVGNAFTKFNP
ncbi:MAG: hypothetical protein IPO02_03800 [Bacteroidetes bacterium]|nr:hypothetical protein [Bacteroidota bacterium]